MEILVKVSGEGRQGPAFPVPTVEHFVLDSAEETLAGRVVRGAAFPAHGPRQPGGLHPLDPAWPAVVPAPVGVHDRTFSSLQRADRLVQHAVRQLRAGGGADRPGDGHAVEAVDDRREVDLARR